jgi:RNA-directed DNA polymerase
MGAGVDLLWQQARGWLYQRRMNAPPDADIWHLRWRWEQEGDGLFRLVTSGKYLLSSMEVNGRGSAALAQWSARDALVLKWVALHVQSQLPHPEACMHLRGGGTSRSLRRVAGALSSGRYLFVHRTDIRGYYAHIRKHQLMNHVERFITDPVKKELIRQYVHYSVERGGEFHTPTYGIPRGCALSPLLGASLLWHVDGYFSSFPDEDIFYVRYMDDFLLLTRTRWQLRRAVSRLAEFFDLSGFERHPDKTQTGRLEKGFDWLGIWFGMQGPSIAPRALSNHRERRMRLYEQLCRRGVSQDAALARVQAYETRWKIWAVRMLENASLPDQK